MVLSVLGGSVCIRVAGTLRLQHTKAVLPIYLTFKTAPAQLEQGTAMVYSTDLHWYQPRDSWDAPGTYLGLSGSHTALKHDAASMKRTACQGHEDGSMRVYLPRTCCTHPPLGILLMHRRACAHRSERGLECPWDLTSSPLVPADTHTPVKHVMH